ncbi:MAG: hypothetical protein MI924_35945, partial [Chloroflexales bacterium]|nr:hypothetical protein [Chloroflexales bacterium]
MRNYDKSIVFKEYLSPDKVLGGCLKRGMECGSHAAARTHGLRIPHVDVPMLRSFPVCDPVLAGSNG